MINETSKYILNKIKDFRPEIGIILGSGLGDFADNLEGIRIKYTNIPGFENSNVAGHKGQLVFAEVEGKKAVIMQGRYHYYEGWHISRIVYPIKVMKKLGVKTLIITNAAGSVNKEYNAGNLMVISDHINLMGANPLIGENDATLGDRFPDMSDIYKHSLCDLAQKKGEELGITLRKGIYAAMSGPSYETPAEINMLRILGADAVGMSTVPEALVANYCGIEVLGISCITNSAAGVHPNRLSHAEVVETAARVKDSFKKFLTAVIAEI
jgi:purine-nucleoside phosphorylase